MTSEVSTSRQGVLPILLSGCLDFSNHNGCMGVSSDRTVRARKSAQSPQREGKFSSEILLSSAAMASNLQTNLRPRKPKGKNHCV